ncbi:hypothetical protein V2J09_010302 [Rumex salicifolius]
MAGLQRSAISFRRQGSSGSVWDDKFLSELEFTAQQEEKKRQQQQEQEENLKQGLSTETEPAAAADKQEKSGDDHQLQRSKSDGGRRTPTKAYRTVKVAEVEEPPSPKVAACGFCIFGKSPAKKETQYL